MKMKMTTKLIFLLLAFLGARALDVGESEVLKPPPPPPPKKWHCQCFDDKSGPPVAAAGHDAPVLNLTLTGLEWAKKEPWSSWIPRCGCKPFELGPHVGNGKGPVVVPAPLHDLGIDIVILVPSPLEK